MCIMFQLLNLLALLVTVRATDILLPLYVYPGTNGVAWTPITKVIDTYPNVRWQIIVNPQTGPGTNLSNPYPNDDYIAGIKVLNGRSNVKLLGYVDTAFGRRAEDDIKSDIARYADWANYSDAHISVDGIFFDDVPSKYDFQVDPHTQSSNDTLFESISAYAQDTLISVNKYITFNSGNPGPPSFFQYCDTMIEFENKYSTYNGQATLDSITSNGGNLNQSAIITYNVPTTLTASDLISLVFTMNSQGVQYVGLTNDCCYDSLNATLLNLIAAACNDTGSSTSEVAESAMRNRSIRLSISSQTTSITALFALAMILLWMPPLG